ncbi:helix-turn-helix domain-containing protein [Gordonia sp. CPCC 205515]|uniref:winged helix-turn-helix transcriptional regulator n=1 Tax=Gordonia sp. CPCC 205515 TaxID=3140791 RepID=UPI003AF3F11F
MAPTPSFTALETDGANAVAIAFGLLGDEWNLWILRRALAGSRRYQDWMGRGQISNAVLTARLGLLTDAGLFTRSAYQQRPVRHEYLLTERGRGVWPILLGMWAWEARWSTRAPDQLPRMVHAECGAEFTPQLVCRHCDDDLDLTTVTASAGPSGHWSRSVPAARGRRRSTATPGPEPAVPDTLTLIGNRWSTALLGALMLGANRFRDLTERTGASPAIITERLGTFVAAGVVDAAPNPTRADWVTYHLSDKGRAFFPVVLEMIIWGQRWFQAPDGPALIFHHGDDGHAPEPEWRCDNCTHPVSAASVVERRPE